MKESKKSKEELRWETERDFDTLMAYQKLVKDPERLERAQKLAKEKQKELSAILKTKKED